MRKKIEALHWRHGSALRLVEDLGGDALAQAAHVERVLVPLRETALQRRLVRFVFSPTRSLNHMCHVFNKHAVADFNILIFILNGLRRDLNEIASLTRKRLRLK